MGLEVAASEVATGAAALELAVVGVYTVEKLDTGDEVAAVAHLGCPTFPQPKAALAATAYGFCPLCAVAAALGKFCTIEYEVLLDTTPVLDTISTTRDCNSTSITAPGKFCQALLLVFKLLTNVHCPFTNELAKQLALNEHALLQAARFAYPACVVILLLAGND